METAAILVHREMNAADPSNWQPEKLSLSIVCALEQLAHCRSSRAVRNQLSHQRLVEGWGRFQE